MKIYIACGLTHVPRSEFDNYVSFIHGLASHLTSVCAASVRYALRDSDPQLAEMPLDDRARLCYQWDRHMVEWADIVVADASYPSTGLGIELEIASSRNTPIVIAFRQIRQHRAAPIAYETPDHKLHHLQLGEGYVSLMALGLPSVRKVVSYSGVADAYSAVTDAVRLLDRGSSRDNVETEQTDDVG